MATIKAKPKAAKLEVMHPDAAAVDVGGRSHHVAIRSDAPGPTVREFGCYTKDLHAMADWLLSNGVKIVALESTGVYWIPVYEVLERRGLEVLLVHARHVKGRSDQVHRIVVECVIESTDRARAMKQQTLATGGFDKYGRKTRRALFLEEMERVVPWSELCALIEPHYPKAGRGRRPIGLERMLRLHFLQHWFKLSDPGLEDALYESASMRQFVGIDLGREPVPDETTVCKFRHLLEDESLGKEIFARVGQQLQSKGFKLSEGTIVDATLISAPGSTKNAAGQRDPEMGTTKKGNRWYYGMKAHVGVDHKSKLIHSVVATPGNVADGQVIEQLLHGRERLVYGDKAYVGLTAAIKRRAPKAHDQTLKKAQKNWPLKPVDEHINQLRSRIRSRVEHVFGVIKCVFGFDKLRYKGIAKNANHLFVSAALCNLFMVRRKLA